MRQLIGARCKERAPAAKTNAGIMACLQSRDASPDGKEASGEQLRLRQRGKKKQRRTALACSLQEEGFNGKSLNTLHVKCRSTRGQPRAGIVQDNEQQMFQIAVDSVNSESRATSSGFCDW